MLSTAVRTLTKVKLSHARTEQKPNLLLHFPLHFHHIERDNRATLRSDPRYQSKVRVQAYAKAMKAIS